jgi:sulfiredoxin
MEIPLDQIRRPLMRTRANDPAKVQELMDSIRVIGLQVPVGIYINFFSFQIINSNSTLC